MDTEALKVKVNALKFDANLTTAERQAACDEILDMLDAPPPDKPKPTKKSPSKH